MPLQEAAIRELRDRSMSLDIYVWLAWRLHTLAKATPVSWPAIHAQFGTGFRELRHFRRASLKRLAPRLPPIQKPEWTWMQGSPCIHPGHPSRASPARG